MAEVKGDQAVKNNLNVTRNVDIGRNTKIAPAGGLDSPYFEFIDEKPVTESAGTFTAGLFETRDLTNVVHNDFAESVIPAAVSGDGAQFTVPAGVYFIEASAPAFGVDEHAARLSDVTDGVNEGTVVITGTSEYSPIATGAHPTGAQTRSFVSGRFEVTRTTDLQLQHKCAITGDTDGFGSALGAGLAPAFYITNNIYSVVKLWRVRNNDVLT